jgi:hypothetical protein
MRTSASAWNAALFLSVASLLSFLARSFIDYGFVYRELYPSTRSIAVLIVITLAFIAGWIWALLAASHKSRPGMYALLTFGAVVVLHGVATMVVLCPSPCRTAWPIGEVVIWSNLLVGIPAVAAAVTSLTQKVA